MNQIAIINLLNISAEDQQALEDEGIVLSIKPNIPIAAQNRSQAHVQLPNVASVSNFGVANSIVSSSTNQSMLPYSQNYFGNQSIANNFPSSNVPNPIEPMNRRKSIIDNINPFVNEQQVLPQDLLSAFPVSTSLFVDVEKKAGQSDFHFHFCSIIRKICCMFAYRNCQWKVSRFC